VGGAAGRDGVRPAALTLLVAHLRRNGGFAKAAAKGRGCAAPAGLIAIEKGRPRGARGLDVIPGWLSLPTASARWRWRLFHVKPWSVSIDSSRFCWLGSGPPPVSSRHPPFPLPGRAPSPILPTLSPPPPPPP